MKTMLTAIAILMLSGVVFATAQDATQATASAKTAFAQGEAARKTGDLKAAVKDYRRAIELDPAYTEAHEAYIRASQDAATHDLSSTAISGKPSAEQEAQLKKKTDEANAQLQAEYTKWSEEHPKVAGYQWALGFLNDYKDPEAAIGFYQSALKIDPKFARAYFMLSTLDEARGNLTGMREDLHKAVEADPDDVDYLYYYAEAFRNFDRTECTRLSLEVVHRFPASSRAAQAIYWLATDAPAESDKLRYLEMLRDDQAPDAKSWRDNGMLMLFDIYQRTDRARALALAQEMVKAGPEDAMWHSLSSYTQAMVVAAQLLKDGKPHDALNALSKITLPKWYHSTQLLLMRSRALNASGKKQDAYEALLEAYASTPTDETHSLLIQYGQELGKNDGQVDSDVRQLQVKNSRPAVPFSLPDYASHNKMSLADFHGHVILLNFWYPECGPCRGEFPYIQAVLDKYKNQGFEIVAVNVEPEEGAFVMPLLKGFKLGFIPLERDDHIVSDYHVRAEPTNFLIGADGRIYFGPMSRIQSPEDQRTLELQVGALLQARHNEAE